MIYNMLQIFTLEQHELLRNVVTRFSQLHFFFFFNHSGTFSRFIAQCILLIFFYSKDQTFLYKLLGQIFKICSDCSDIWKSLKELKTVFAILSLKWPLHFNENEFKKTVPTIFRRKIFLDFETKFNIFYTTWHRENVPCQKPRFYE